MADKEMPHAQQLQQLRVRQTAQLAERCIERMDSKCVRGKRRDDAVLEYFVGASEMADITGDTMLSEHLTRICALVIALDGFKGLQRLIEAAKPD